MTDKFLSINIELGFYHAIKFWRIVCTTYRDVTHYSIQEDVVTAVGGCQSKSKYTSKRKHGQGRIQEFWLGGGVFFSKAWDLEAALMPPLGPGQRLCVGPEGEAPGRF